MWADRLPDYSVSGHSNATVFLLHGVYGAKEYWRFVTQRLVNHGYRVVAWDAPGYGLSPPHDDFQLSTAATACANLIAKLGTSRNLIFGQSMGGQIAMRTNSRIPGLVSGLIISSTIGYLGNKSPAEQEDFVTTRLSSDSDTRSVVDKNMSMVTSMMPPGASGPDVELVKTIAAATPGPAVQSAVKAIQAAPDQEALDALRSIRVPTLFVAGEKDNVGRPEGMRRLASLVPNSEFEIIAGCGHYGWAEKPELFWTKLAPFLRRVIPVGVSPA